nr:PREDICTED: uncharacterized protein LOC106701837 [Latimeria chalumnae]|eukprot:XP_014339268.1 PREDICTED: uncharacterized protein LOC106701837 [Latimeria chalumnae]
MSAVKKRSGCLFLHVFVLSSLTLFGTGNTLQVTIHKETVSGTENKSVLLLVSYTATESVDNIRITWYFKTNLEMGFQNLRRYNASSGTDAPFYSRANHIDNSYKNRIVIFPENGSLLFHHLQLNDSGEYSVKFDSTGKETIKKKLTLIVHEQLGLYAATPLEDSIFTRGCQEQLQVLKTNYH